MPNTFQGKNFKTEILLLKFYHLDTCLDRAYYFQDFYRPLVQLLSICTGPREITASLMNIPTSMTASGKEFPIEDESW